MYEADCALVARMCAGDQRAFDEFFNASAARLVAFAARRTSLDSASLEDIVQSALIKAVCNLDSYRGEAALFTWLTEICRHEMADVLVYLVRLADKLDVDLNAAVRDKMVLNRAKYPADKVRGDARKYSEYPEN